MSQANKETTQSIFEENFRVAQSVNDISAGSGYAMLLGSYQAVISGLLEKASEKDRIFFNELLLFGRELLQKRIDKHEAKADA